MQLRQTAHRARPGNSFVWARTLCKPNLVYLCFGFCVFFHAKHSRLAQLAERWSLEPLVAGSIPVPGVLLSGSPSFLYKQTLQTAVPSHVAFGAAARTSSTGHSGVWVRVRVKGNVLPCDSVPLPG